jgi:Glycosyl hydrolase family 63 C-terminal domain
MSAGLLLPLKGGPRLNPAMLETEAPTVPSTASSASAEELRLAEDARRSSNWKRWGPYLSERQWATVREDYSPQGTCWDYFPHDHARSRVYRWGEDGLLGFCDRQCRLCFSLALWNGRDPILKERLFGLTGPEGNHGEDAKESWFYLDSSPTHSYCRGLYKYPHAEFPYRRLVEENRQRGRDQPEFELGDTGVFDQSRYFDVEVEYAKRTPDDILIRIRITNRGPESAALHLLPTLWFRNTWSWGCEREGTRIRPRLRSEEPGRLRAMHESLGDFFFEMGPDSDGAIADVLFTENETNRQRLWGVPNEVPHVKDAFHQCVVGNDSRAVSPIPEGTKAAPWYRLELPPAASQVFRLRLVAAAAPTPRELSEGEPDQDAGSKAGGRGVWTGLSSSQGLPHLVRRPEEFDELVELRRRETDEFYHRKLPAQLTDEERNVVRQGYAGLLWSKQFYHYIVDDWLEGDCSTPKPPNERQSGRNRDWRHLYARDVISMPDKWEYPWFAAWDLAFHMLPFARIDGEFAKHQIGLFLREWYMHPNGQIPAYEFALGDVNPPVHAWAAWRVYKMTGPAGGRDLDFLESVFQKLLLNFTWWVNRKDSSGRHLFSGGFLGLDNIGVFDRSQPLPTGGELRQADGTAWMAFYCSTMLAMALELARGDGGRIRKGYEDMASKFLEHFVQIADAMNTLGGSGLWDETDGFYYDQLDLGGHSQPLRTRSLVGLLPLIAVEVIEESTVDRLPGFKQRLLWFARHRHDLAGIAMGWSSSRRRLLLAIPTRDRLRRALRFLSDELEFLSPYGIRSLSKFHEAHPFVVRHGVGEYRVDYSPGESTTGLFGGNSNWRGPIWFPVNYLLIEALERYHHFYGPEFQIEFPHGSGRMLNLHQVSVELERRLVSLFLPDREGNRPANGRDERFATDLHWKHLVQFPEYFHAETGRGLGAMHQTGWTALVVRSLENLARQRGVGPD